MLRGLLRRMSIELKVPLMGGLLILAVIVAVLWAGYVSVRRSAEEAALDRLPTVVLQVVGGLQRQARVLSLRTLALTRDSTIQAYFASPSPTTNAAALQWLRESRATDSSYLAIELQSRTGARLLGDVAPSVVLPALSAEDRQPADGSGDSATVGRFLAAGDTVVFPVIAKVFRADSVVGQLVVWLRVNGDSLTRERTTEMIGSGAVVYIGSPHGAWTDQAGLVPAPPVDLAEGKSPTRYLREGVGPRLAAASLVAGTPWAVLVEFPEQLILSPVRSFLASASLFALAVFGIGMLAAWIFSRRLMAPLKRLTVAAGSMATGEHAVLVPVEREDEVGRLASAFNQMVKRVGAESRARSASETQWRLLFDRNPHPMWVYDVESLQFLAVNMAAVRRYGWSAEEFAGMTVEMIRPKEDRAGLRSLLARASAWTGAPLAIRHWQKDGTLLDVEVNAHETLFDGRTARLVLAQDVSQRKALERQLLQSQKMEAIGRLAGGVAHDFNNILLVISANGELVQSSLPPGHPVQDDLSEVIHAVDRGRGLTRQLLAFSRQQVLQPVEVDLNMSVHELEGMLRRLLGEDVEIAAQLVPTLGLVLADPGQVQQVLLNLAVNARDAMPMGGKLTMTTHEVEVDEASRELHGLPTAGHFAVVTMTDTGIGMSPETRARIFEPFFTTKPPGQGTGLGLATAYGIVTQSGGTITVYSELEQGTTFRIYLPIAAERRVTATPSAGPVAERGGGESVLLVEDEPAVRAAAVMMLGRLGYTVLPAGTVEEALAIGADPNNRIDLVISDVVMPRMDGPTVVARLQQQRPGLKAILMSGYTGDSLRFEWALEPSISFLEKPFSLVELAHKVRTTLEQGE